MSKFFDEVLSKYQCGFRREHGAQHCLIVLLEKWRISVDQGLEFGTLLTDLSKAFDCLPHSLLLAKLSANRFDMTAVRFINNYLRNRKQITKISDTSSSWEGILYEVPQGSMLRPLLFNIHLLYSIHLMYLDKNIYEVVKSLEKVSHLNFKWFSDNQFQRNTSKCHVLLNTDQEVVMHKLKIVKMKSC